MCDPACIKIKKIQYLGGDFYEQFILMANKQGAGFSDKQIASLIMMRANDRASVEDYDDIHLLMADEARKNHRRFLELAKANI